MIWLLAKPTFLFYCSSPHLHLGIPFMLPNKKENRPNLLISMGHVTFGIDNTYLKLQVLCFVISLIAYCYCYLRHKLSVALYQSAPFCYSTTGKYWHLNKTIPAPIFLSGCIFDIAALCSATFTYSLIL